MPGVMFWRRTTHEGNGREPGAPAAIERPSPSADLPYLRGRAEFDSVFADLAKGKRNWQLVAFGALAVAGVLAGGLVTLATQTRITPYVVEVDKLGRAQAFGPAERLRVTDQRVITSQLAGFVRDIRTVLADPVAQAELVRHSYAFVDQNAAAFLNGFFASSANDPRLLAKDATRLVEVTSVLPVPGSSTWKVSWTETTIPRTTGGAPSVAAWEGYFGTRIVPPATTERITLNPLGLYVSSVNWTQLATRALSVPAAPAASTLGTPTQPSTPPSSSPPPSQE
jgi:type IV secretion system protein VirB5